MSDDRRIERPWRWPFLLVALIVEGMLLTVAWLGGKLLGVPVLGGAWLDPRSVILGFAAVLPLVAMMVWTLVSRADPLVALRRQVDALVAELFAGRGLWELALVAALAGLCEEALFRGLIQQGLSGVIGVWPAVLVSATLFGLTHAVSKTYAALCVVIGLYLGALLVFSGNLFVPILAHGVYDFVALVYLVRFRTPRTRQSFSA